MINEFFKYIGLLFILGGLGTVCLIIAILNIKKARLRNYSLLGAALIFGLTAVTLYSLIKYKSRDFMDEVYSQISLNMDMDNPDIMNSGNTIAASLYCSQVKFLEALQPVEKNVPQSYMLFLGLREMYYRCPLVYPYSINSNNGLEWGTLKNETGIEKIYDSINAPTMVADSIVRFSFSKKLFLGEQFPSGYVLLHFDSGVVERFASEDAVRKRTAMLGFEPKQKTTDMADYFDLFWRE